MTHRPLVVLLGGGYRPAVRLLLVARERPEPPPPPVLAIRPRLECPEPPSKTDDSSDHFETECGEAYCLIDGTLKENKHRFCPYCGHHIITVDDL